MSSEENSKVKSAEQKEEEPGLIMEHKSKESTKKSKKDLDATLNSKSKEKSKESIKNSREKSKESIRKSKSKESIRKSKSKESVGRSKSKESTGKCSKSKKKPKSVSGKKSKSSSGSDFKNQKTSVISKGSKTSDTGCDEVNKEFHKKQRQKIDIGGARIGFVGAGKMTDAIVKGLLTYAKVDHKRIFISAKSFRNLDAYHNRGIMVTKRPYDIFGQFDCDVVFMCVHGFVIRACFKGGGTRPLALTTNYIPNQKHPLYILSLIGGVTLQDIRLTLLDPDYPEKYMIEMHRIMLNIGVGYGMGLGAIDVEPDSKQCSPLVRDILSSLTNQLEFHPHQIMDAICIIGGNGLAFCYYWLAAMADGGFKMGLNKQMAIKLATKALQSASQCLLESGKHPSELQDAAISSGGPAIYGIHVLDQTDCASGFQSAIDTAYRRLRELVNIEPITEIEAKP